MHVKCNWYRMGTIVLTVKGNNCKKQLHCQKQPQGLFFEKIIETNQAKQVAYTPNKFAKQSY